MDRVPAEITEKVGMLLKNHDFDTGAGQKKAEHHAGGPAARDAALGAKDLRIAVGHFLRDLSITLCRCSATAPYSSALARVSSSFVRRPVLAGKAVGGVDERQVRQRLGKIAELDSGFDVIFFGEQADIVADRKEALEDAPALFGSALENEVVGEPEAAREKNAFARRQAVAYRVGVIAAHETIDHEALLDRGEGADDAGIARRKKTDERNEQGCGIDLWALIGLYKGADLRAEASGADLF